MNDAPLTAPAEARLHRPECIAKADLAPLFATCAWFRALAAEHRALVLASAHAEHTESGAWIARRQEPSDYWIGVHPGLIKLAIYNASGRSCTFSGVPPGGWFGEGSVIKRELRKYDVAAIQASLVLFVPVRYVPCAARIEPAVHGLRDPATEQPHGRIHRVDSE
jgi:CRP/FNR family transcriptional regulator, cyclic AMP receptor protein